MQNRWHWTMPEISMLPLVLIMTIAAEPVQQKGCHPVRSWIRRAESGFFRADQPNQQFSDGKRFATGVKNAVGIDWDNKTNALYATTHGRGKFDDMYPQYYTSKHSAELPSEKRSTG